MIHCANREMFKIERALTRWNTKATHTRISWDSAANAGKAGNWNYSYGNCDRYTCQENRETREIR